MAKKRCFNGKPNLNKFVVILSNIVIYIQIYNIHFKMEYKYSDYQF